MKFVRNMSMCEALACSVKALQAVYERMLKEVVDACDAAGISADPLSVTTDFEAAAMNAAHTTFGTHVAVHGCFFNSTCAKAK